MNKNTKRGARFPRRGFFPLLIILLLGFFLTIVSISFQRNPEPACHGAGLGAGFPLPFICDDTGGSPISSWGRIDLSDIYRLNMRVFLLDFLLYNSLISLVVSTAMGLYRNDSSKVEISHWALALCMTFLLAFLFAFLSFQSGNLNFDIPIPTTPTPIISTPTPIGTPAFPPVAPT